MGQSIGILTAGGDSPGLNAAIRGIGKAAIRSYDMNVIGFKDGFKGLMQQRFIRLDSESLSGILTKGGTILGTSREKPHKMDIGGKVMDMTDVMFENFASLSLDALVCLGGGGTAKNALRLAKRGMPVVTLPKTIDNDVWGTDVTFGFDTALGIAIGGDRPAALDRPLPPSHHRGGGHGPQHWMAGARVGPRRWRRRHPDPGDPLLGRSDLRLDPRAKGRRQHVQHRGRV